jgi:hypothetical protein
LGNKKAPRRGRKGRHRLTFTAPRCFATRRGHAIPLASAGDSPTYVVSHYAPSAHLLSSALLALLLPW